MIDQHGEPDVHDMVRALTTTTTHRERYTKHEAGTTWSLHHITTVPPLIDQLIGVTGNTTGSGEEAGSTPTSRPAARIESLDTLALIDHEASRWLRSLGRPDPVDRLDAAGNSVTGSGTIACLRALGAAYPGIARCANSHVTRSEDGKGWCCEGHLLRRDLEVDVRRWWRQARVMAGWDSVAWRPDNTCPLCEKRRTLRINLTARTALCVECRSTWGPSEIGLLADHIRLENAEDTDDQAEETAGPSHHDEGAA